VEVLAVGLSITCVPAVIGCWPAGGAEAANLTEITLLGVDIQRNFYHKYTEFKQFGQPSLAFYKYIKMNVL